jgi:hypothetical protein
MQGRFALRSIGGRGLRAALLGAAVAALAVPAAEAATYTGTLWHDVDNDGLRDAGEPLLPNVPVRLLRPDFSFVKSTVTDANGVYSLTASSAGQTRTVEVMSGWFRSACVYGVSATCDPGGDNDFRVDDERVLATTVVPADDGVLVNDAGLVPDWGDPATPYPGAGGPFNGIDVAVRASGLLSSCADPPTRLCGLGQAPRASVQVFNQGVQELRDVQVTLTFDPSTAPQPGQPLALLRDLPPGLTLAVVAPFDAATHQATVLLQGGIPPASAVTFDVPQQLVRGPLSPLPFSNGIGGLWSKEFFAEASAIGYPGPDIDATNDANPRNDKLLGHQVNAPAKRDDDDHDDVGFNLGGYDLALRAVPAVPALQAGGATTVTYTVVNQGNLPVSGVQLSAYVPAGVRVAGVASEGWIEHDGGRWSTTIGGTIVPGASASVLLGVVGDVGGVHAIGGEVLSFSRPTLPGIPATDVDSTPDTLPGNDVLVDDAIANEGGDEDDADVAAIVVAAAPGGGPAACTPDGSRPDLALRITRSGKGRILAGTLVTLKIEVLNQGRRAAHDVRVGDYLAARGRLALVAKKNAGWVRRASGRVERRIAVLPAGKKATILLRVRPKAGASGTTLRNVAEITSALDACGKALGDVDSKPDTRAGNDKARVDNAVNNKRGDEDDHDWVRLIVRRP